MRAKIVKTKPIVNQVLDDKNAIEFYKMEIKRLQEELNNGKNNKNNDKDNLLSEKEKNEMIKKEIEKYRNNEQIGSSKFYLKIFI
jgi:hypothetical protein